MGMFDRFIKTEERELENPDAPVSADDFLHIMGWGDFSSTVGVTVNVDNALGVPAVWSAVNFISGTLASLPLKVYRRTDTGYHRVRDGVGVWLDRAVNPTLSSCAWRKYIFEQVLTGGRSVMLIVRNGAAVDLSGATVRFHMRKLGKGTVVVDGAATVTGAFTGQVRYAWSGSDTASIGTYNGEFEVTYSDGAIETFPNNGFISIEITDDLA